MILRMIRGDTAGFYFQEIDQSGEPMTNKADKVFFTVKNRPTDQDFVLQKTIEDMEFDESGNYTFTIQPADTNELKFGKYFYDIEVIRDGVKTTLTLDEFIIEPEVTWVENEG